MINKIIADLELAKGGVGSGRYPAGSGKNPKKEARGDKPVQSWNSNNASVHEYGNRVELQLSPEGIQEAKEAMESGKSHDEIMADIMEQHSSNSDLRYSTDLGNEGAGLTEAPGFTRTSYDEKKDKEKLEDVYHDPHYQIRSHLDDLIQGKKVVFNKA